MYPSDENGPRNTQQQLAIHTLANSKEGKNKTKEKGPRFFWSGIKEQVIPFHVFSV